ncbi:MAG: hypothetical protein ACJ735_03695 [Actinomycetes bacterium]
MLRTPRRAAAVAGVAGLACLTLLALPQPGVAAGAGPRFHPPSRADAPPVQQAIGATSESEPATVIGKDGTRYVAYQGGSQLSWTRDGGKHWTYVGGNNPVSVLSRNVTGCIAADDIGDVDLTVDQVGRVYFADLQGTVGTGGADTGIEPVVATSDDRFAHYSGTCAAHQPASVDREWMAAWTAPGKPASRSDVYMSYHDFSINTIWVNASHDGGKTWGPPVNAITSPDAVGQSFCDTIPGGTAVDPRTGWVYAAWLAGSNTIDNVGTGCNYTQGSVFNNLWVAVSKDRGATWTDTHAVTTPGVTAPSPSDSSEIFASIAADTKGGVYVSLPTYVSGQYQMYVVYSPEADGAGLLHFRPPVKVNAPEAKTAYFGRIVAGDTGRIDILYLGSSTANVNATPTNIAADNGTDTTKPNCVPGATEPGHGVKFPGKPCELPATAKWYLYMAQSLDFTSSKPAVSNTLLRSDPVHVGDICTAGIFCLPGDDRDLADTNDIKIDPTGGAQVAYTYEKPDRSETNIQFQCQQSGTGLYAGVNVRDCQAAAAVTTRTTHGVNSRQAHGGRGLATTGGLHLALPALFVVLLAIVVRRRRALRCDGKS